MARYLTRQSQVFSFRQGTVLHCITRCRLCEKCQKLFHSKVLSFKTAPTFYFRPRYHLFSQHHDVHPSSLIACLIGCHIDLGPRCSPYFLCSLISIPFLVSRSNLMKPSCPTFLTASTNFLQLFSQWPDNCGR